MGGRCPHHWSGVWLAVNRECNVQSRATVCQEINAIAAQEFASS